MPSAPEPSGATRLLRLASDRRDIGWQVTVIASVVYLAIWLRDIVASPTGLLAPASLAVVALVIAGQWLLLWLVRRAFLDGPWWVRHPLPATIAVAVVVVLASALVAMLARLAGATPGSGILAEESWAIWGQRVLAFLVVTAAWAAIDDYRTALAREQALREQLTRARDEGIAQVEAQRAEVVTRVDEMFRASLEQIERGADAAIALDRLARDRIRPLSHDLAGAMPAYRPEAPPVVLRPRWQVVLDAVTEGSVIRPLLMAALVTFFFMWTTFSTQTSSAPTAPPELGRAPDPPDALADSGGFAVTVDWGSLLQSFGYLALVFVTTWALGAVAVRLSRRNLPRLRRAWQVFWVLITPVIMAVVVEVVLYAAFDLSGLGSTADLGLAQRIVVVTPIFVIALLILAVRAVAGTFAAMQDEQRLLTAQLEWEVARTGETLTQERRVLATALHGPMQSSVAAAAMTIEAAERRGEGREAAWTEAERGLLASIGALAAGPSTRRDLAADLEGIQHTWRGLSEVVVHLDAECATRLAHDWVAAGTLADLVTEAVANAVMHGRAQHVWVHIGMGGPASVRVWVDDDGSGPGSGESGLGSQHLDEVALEWSREATGGGTRLAVTIPVSPESALA